MTLVSEGGVALVTGASSGIGEAFARALARRKVRLVLVARSREKLEALSRELAAVSGKEASVLALDLSRRDAPARLYSETEGRGLAVDLLVNNAGFGLNAPFDETPLERILEMLDLNIAALTALTRLFLAPMKARGRGSILNVASTASFVAGPYFAAYSASKAYVRSFSHALHHEARPHGVTVTALCPGYTNTNFNVVAGMKRGAGGLVPRQDAGRVAEIGLSALERRKPVRITNPLDFLWIFSLRIAPAWLPPVLAAALFRYAREKQEKA